ncbi:UDP-glucose 4-epimerase GalE [Idiomarina sp.]|uniref:UDP-glucose 4-epimerase GalE n=1 Tax=Idiomarina sp. TaxID=1874361 RepID=UPI00258CA04C|nr:UDP-glucose 4-epimerase GalE [Idiomarina sp.]
MNILVIGGAGYIGSHTVLSLLSASYKVIVVDSLTTGFRESLRRVEKIASCKVPFYEVDVRDEYRLSEVFRRHKVDAVIHFAALKSVSESQNNPISYYSVNFSGTLSLTNVMKKFDVKCLVFSSSATVYGKPDYNPIDESHPTGKTLTPYGTSKHFVERFLFDLVSSDKNWSISVLRYFNPVGADPLGRIGEASSDKPNNLVPFIAKVALGETESLSVFGDDYDTPDGTGIRDYIHVLDLAEAHVSSLDFLNKNKGYHVFNIGTGNAHSVLEVVAEFEKISSKTIPLNYTERRLGDVSACYADPSKAQKLLGWKASRTLTEMLESMWNWQQRNPRGYEQ